MSAVMEIRQLHVSLLRKISIPSSPPMTIAHEIAVELCWKCVKIWTGC
jgi:hypothetical protein